MKRAHSGLAILTLTAILLMALAGCGGVSAGPHNEQERLVDQVLRARLQGDFEPALAAIPPDYLEQIKAFLPDLSDEELRSVLITSLQTDSQSAFSYAGAEIVEIFYRTESQGGDRARVFYWGTIQYQEAGETKTQNVTQKDAETEGFFFPLVKQDGKWYWDLELP
jgi:hypothetical protein